MKKLIALSVFFLFIWMSSCTEEVDDGNSFTDPNPNDVEFRVANETKFTLEAFKLNTFSKEGNYGQLRPTKVSFYQSYPTAHSVLGISFDVNGHAFEYLPSNYSAEDLLEGDRYQITLTELDTIHRTFAFLLETVKD